MDTHKELESLNRILAYCQNSAFYRDRIPNHALKTWQEFKALPLTTKADLRKHSPFGLLAASPNLLYQYHESFGTTGIPISSWFTREDIEDTVKILQAWGGGFNPHDIVLIRFPYAISSPAHLVQAAAQAQGACVIPASSRSTVSPFPRIVNMLQKLKVTVIAGLPLQMVLIAETAELMGLNPRDSFPELRAIFTAGEALPAPRRELLENIWGKPVFDHYGMTEFGPVVVDCACQVPHPQDDYFYLEILKDDLKSEVEPGEIGFLVITTLKRQGSPLIRYMTGDRAQMTEWICPCGRKVILKIRGRQEDIIKVDDRQFDRWDLEEIVSQLPGRRFWAAGPIKEGIHIIAEQEKSEDQIGKELHDLLEQRYRMKLKIDIVPAGTLFDRSELLDIGVVGKPQYIYTAAEMEQMAYLKSART
ncbi:AMP-dependent synthetase/ligase [Syntrophomonas zehnderi OL-4]|uniref:AMP-dependent synthetase/ligase n=1 Tax=Syntrophomonas zehnderi OL-4 TaxID=690567 RepID=A0A0E4GE81_9FIRM|nr:AMP-binding protein [Syntrophomonas zehnderi]CFX77989.1 AMP-dependent synthetase/ligase [Syntrophomonas zehnderi OL-4]